MLGFRVKDCRGPSTSSQPDLTIMVYLHRKSNTNCLSNTAGKVLPLNCGAWGRSRRQASLETRPFICSRRAAEQLQESSGHICILIWIHARAGGQGVLACHPKWEGAEPELAQHRRHGAFIGAKCTCST